MKIAILGTRGIPASYSGFETSVEETSVRFVRKNIDTSVYCRSNHFLNKLNEFQGVKLIYLPSFKSKHLDTITHTFFSVFHLLFKNYNIIVMYGVGNALFIPIIKLFGFPVISVVDGADWKREKWDRFSKRFLKFNRNFAARYSNYYVVDNESLVEEYSKEFKEKPVYIPYGANLEFEENPEILKNYGLDKKGYIIFIGRFVKEKGIDFLVKNFEKTNTKRKLVIVGDNTTDKDYVSSLKATNDPRIIFTGFLYGNNYETLLHNALFYVSCSFLEGTSPSLLSAMAINGFALVSDLEENIEVLKGSCATFLTGNAQDFLSRLNYYLNDPGLIDKERTKTTNIVKEYYTWEKITEKYIELFNVILERTK